MTVLSSRSLAMRELLTDLARPRPSSWCLRIPPGCDGDFRVKVLERVRESKLFAVASVSGDKLQDDEAFLRKTSEDWQQERPERGDAAANERFEAMVCSLKSSGVRPLLLFDRFHKGAESLSHEMLASLRELESERVLVSILISHVGHRMLRKRLSEHGVPYVTSNYGDQHSSLRVGPLEQAECEEMLDEFHVDKAFALGLINMTGGLPELFEKSARHLANGDTGRNLVVELARDPILERLLDWIADTPEGRELDRRRLVRLFLRIHDSEDLAFFDEHEWSDLLVTEGGLKSELLGMAALRQPSGLGHIRSTDREAIRLYENGAYAAAAEILKFTRPKDDASHRATKVMSLVSVSLETLDRSTEWQGIAVEARAGIEMCDGKQSLSETAKGFQRWIRNAELLAPLQGVSELDKQLECLVKERSAEEAAQAAVLFLGLRLHAAKRQPSPTLSAQLALAVPESTLKAWAANRLKLHGGTFLDFDREPFRARRDYWWGGKFDFPKPPRRIRGLAELCVAVGCLQEVHLPRNQWFFESPEILGREVGKSGLLNPMRHNVFVCDAAQRDEILGLSEAWLGRLAVVGGHLDIRAVYRQLEPIPLPGQTGGRWR